MTVMDKRKKQSRTRTWFQAAWFSVTNGYLRGYTSGKIFAGGTKRICVPGLNCYSCPGAFGSCPIGSLQAVLDSRNYKISLYVFGFLTVFGVLFGRLVCGWMCPFGLVQDLLYKIKTKFKKKNLPGHKYLRYVRFVLLIVFVILLPSCVVDATGTGKPTFCEFICPSGLLLGGIPLTILNEGFRAAIGIRFIWKTAILLAVAVGSIFYFRPFCKYLCPLGAIYGCFNSVSTYRLEIDHDKCIKCGACQKACGMDIKTFETPNSMDCIRCGACISACPKEAISSTWGNARKNITSRCFIDDTVSDSQLNAAELTPQPGKALVFGIILILFGVIGLIGGVIGVINAFQYNLVYGMETPMTGIAYSLFKLASCIILLATGVYAIRNRYQAEKLLVLRERVACAVITLIIGLVVMGIVTAMNSEAIGPYALYTLVFFIMAFSPLLIPFASSLEKQIKGQKAGAGWAILLVILTLAILGQLTFLAMAYGLIPHP